MSIKRSVLLFCSVPELMYSLGTLFLQFLLLRKFEIVSFISDVSEHVDGVVTP